MAIWTSLPSGSTGASRTAEGSCSTALPSKPSRWSQQLTSRSSGPRRRTGPETTTPWGYLSEIDTPLAPFVDYFCNTSPYPQPAYRHVLDEAHQRGEQKVTAELIRAGWG